MHLRPGQMTSEQMELTERAQAAVRAFRSMQHQLSNYARAFTGNPKARVEVASGAPRTDGTVIYYQPPIALGDRTPHDRYLCGKRRDDGLQACAACRIREEVLVNIYHEISHIAEQTFIQTSDRAKKEALDLAIAEWGGSFEQQIKARMRTEGITNSYLGLANIISPFLPSLVNTLEDARVDLAMFNRRKGTRKMMVADTFNMLKNGIPNAHFELQMWNEAPLNSQVSIAVYLEAAIYPGWQQYFHPSIGETVADSQIQKIIEEVRLATKMEQTYELAFPILARLRELGYFKMPEEEEKNDDGSDAPEDSSEDDSDESEEQASDERDSEGDPSADDEQSDQREAGDDGTADDSQSQAGDSEGAGDQGGDADSQSGGQADSTPSGQGESEGNGASEPQEPSGEPEDGRGSSDQGAGSSGSPQDGAEGSGGRGELGSPDGGEQDVSPGMQGHEEEPVDADSDGVPPESGRDGRGEEEGGDEEPDGGPGVSQEESDGEGSGEADSSDPDGESVDGSADSDDTDSDARGDQDAPGSLGDAGSDDSGELDDRQDGEESGESDHDSGESGERSGDGGTGAEPIPSPSSAGESDQLSQSSGDDEDGSGERSDRDSSEPSGELIDSGADQGLGGIDLTQMEMGTPADVESASQHLHNKLEEQGDLQHGNANEKDAIQTAIIQGTYFEWPSIGVTEVIEHQYQLDETGWGPELKYLDDNEIFRLKELGVICDMEIPESALGPALLKTRRAFDDNQASAYNSNMRRGKVNTKVLGRRAWSGDDRLFGKKRVPEAKDYAVKIMVDISTSNWGSNLALVKRSVFAQAELLSRVGIPFSITAHSATNASGRGGRSYAMHLHHIKSWDEPWDDRAKDAVRNLAANGGNVDGHAMEYGRKELMKVSATDKILLYYTDGKFPAANKEEELEVLLRQLHLCKRDRITLLGVGIRTDSPIRHGLDTVQVDGDEDLKRVVEHLGKRLQRSSAR